MEMQPGMLNWNQYRVAPWTGMVQLWTLETFAASGDIVSYFRWRQVPYAQEQTLSGLHVSDGAADEGFDEVQMLVREQLPILKEAITNEEPQADVALIFDYTSVWVWAIEPYSGTWDVKTALNDDPLLQYSDLVYVFYSALRRLGLSIDVIGTDQPLDGYKLVVVPSLPIISDTFNASLASSTGPVVLGPHTGSKTASFATVPGLDPIAGTLRDRLPFRITRVETPPSNAGSGVSYVGTNYSIPYREEWIECARQNRSSKATISYTSPLRIGKPAACASEDGLYHYLAFNPPTDLLVAYLGDVAAAAGISDLTGTLASKDRDLGSSLRLLRRGDLLWAFNYGVQSVAAPAVDNGSQLVIGEPGDIPAAGVVVWKLS